MLDTILSKQYGLIMESSDNVTNYDVKCARLLIENSLSEPENKKIIFMIDNISDKYIKKIDSSFALLSDISVDTNQLSEFFTKIQQTDELGSIPLSTPLKDVNEFGRIKPEYLTQFIKGGALTINNIINGKTSMKDLMGFFMSDISTKLKKQVLVSTTPITDIKSYIASQENPNIVPIDSQAIMTLCVPFLRSFPVRKRELQDEIAAVKNAINASTSFMKSYTDTAMSLKSKGQINLQTIDALNYYLYNVNRVMDDVISYMVFALISKIDAYTFNINSYTGLYQKVLQYNPEGSDLYHESSYEYSLAASDIDSTVNTVVYGNMSPMIDWFDRVYSSAKGLYVNRMTNDSNVHAIDYILDQHTPIQSPYEDFEDTLDKIENGIDRIKSCIKDPFASPEEIMKSVGFDEPLISRFTVMISNITNIENYTNSLNEGRSKTDVLFSILSELRKSQEYMEDLGEVINDVHEEIEEVIEYLDRNPEREIKNELVRSSMLELVTRFEEDFRNFLGIALEKIIQRGKMLEEEVMSIVSHIDEVIDTPDVINGMSYNIFAIESCIDLDNVFSKIRMEAEMIRFRNTKFAKEYGLMTEAEISQNNNAQSSNNQTTNQSNKETSSPEVDSSNQTNSDKKQNTEALNKENPSKDDKSDSEKKTDFKSKIEELIEKINNFFNNTLTNFSKTIEKYITPNNEFLKKYKEAILARSYNNLSLKIYNYFNLDSKTIQSDISKVSAFVSQLSKDDLASYTDTYNLQQKMFGFLKVTGGLTLDDYIRIYYKIGPNQTKLEKISISNTELKNKTADMIKFCEDFYAGDGYKNVQSSISSLKTVLDNKVGSLKNENLTDEQLAGLKNVSGRVMVFSGAVLTGYRNKSQHYMFAIRKLLPKKLENEVEQTNQTEQSNETEEQADTNA